MWNLSLTVDLSNVTLVFRSSCWEEFWKKGVLRNSYALTLKLCQNSWKNYLWSLSACIFTKKNEFFHRYFSRILISFQNSRLFNRLLSNCVFMFINFCSCWDIDLCSFFKFLCFFFIEKTLYWIFWRHFVYFCIWSTSVNMVTVNWESLSPPPPTPLILIDPLERKLICIFATWLANLGCCQQTMMEPFLQNVSLFNPLSASPHKMVKHTQNTILRQQPTSCVTVFDHFVGFAFKGLTVFDHFVGLALKGLSKASRSLDKFSVFKNGSNIQERQFMKIIWK